MGSQSIEKTNFHCLRRPLE